MDIKNKVIVITGGSKGFGKALAKSLKEAGAEVIISSSNQVELERTANEIGVGFKDCNVTSEVEVMKLLEHVVNKHGRVDMFINNAGVWLPHASIEEMDWQRVHEIMEVNFFGTVYGSKHALIQMRKQGYGTIVNILSTSALEGRKNSSGYCATKYAAKGFTKSLKKEAEGSGVQVLAIYPGGMQTNLFDEKKPNDYTDYMTVEFAVSKLMENLIKDIPEEELVIRRNE